MMRVTTIAVLGLTLGCGGSAAFGQSATLKSEVKSVAAPAGVVGTFSSAPQHSLTTGAGLLKLDAGHASSLKSGQTGDAAAPASPGAPGAARIIGGRPSAVSVKPQQPQFIAAAAASRQSSFGIRSSTGGTGADGLKEPELVQKLR